MFIEYFYWHYVESPAWLLRFYWTLQRAVLQIFSVEIMLKTLVSPWRKDQVRYGPGSLSSLFLALAWNAISRGIGFIIRSVVLTAWLISEVIFLLFIGLFFIAFLLWPIVILFSIALGLGLLVHSL